MIVPPNAEIIAATFKHTDGFIFVREKWNGSD